MKNLIREKINWVVQLESDALISYSLIGLAIKRHLFLDYDILRFNFLMFNYIII